jgi:hypothetical protein
MIDRRMAANKLHENCTILSEWISTITLVLEKMSGVLQNKGADRRCGSLGRRINIFNYAVMIQKLL